MHFSRPLKHKIESIINLAAQAESDIASSIHIAMLIVILFILQIFLKSPGMKGKSFNLCALAVSMLIGIILFNESRGSNHPVQFCAATKEG